MSEGDQDEVAGGVGEQATLSASDGVQDLLTPQPDDDINPEKDPTKTKAVGDECTIIPDEDELPGSSEIEDVSVQHPLSAEGEGDGEETAASSEQSLRYANPYGTFITGIDVNSQVCVCVHVCSYGNSVT
jgi:hypothetical protein